jgi:hypothetical protein
VCVVLFLGIALFSPLNFNFAFGEHFSHPFLFSFCVCLFPLGIIDFALLVCVAHSLARTCFWFLFERSSRREFPTSLVAEHKAAVKAFFTKVAAVLSVVAIALATLVSRIFF